MPRSTLHEHLLRAILTLDDARGLGLLTAILLIVGVLGTRPESAAGNYAQAALMLAWLFVYYLTVGPICYAIIGETSSTRLRNKSVCLSRIVYYIAQIICNVINPYMSVLAMRLFNFCVVAGLGNQPFPGLSFPLCSPFLILIYVPFSRGFVVAPACFSPLLTLSARLNPTAGNWKGKTGFFWGGSAFLFFIWTYFRLPEMRGKTYEELDILFARNVRTRDFAKYKVDAYAEGTEALTKDG